MPGSPEISTRRRSPSAAVFHADTRVSSSSVRPARLNPVSIAATSGKGTTARSVPNDQTTSLTAIGSGRPFRSRAPSERISSALRLPASALTRSLTRIWPPSAVAQSREASMTGVPNQSPSSKVASPALTPMRIANVGPRARRLRRSTARCMATAPDRASAAPE